MCKLKQQQLANNIFCQQLQQSFQTFKDFLNIINGPKSHHILIAQLHKLNYVSLSNTKKLF